MFYKIDIKNPDRLVKDMTIGEVAEIIRQVVFWEIHNQINSHTKQYEYQKGYFIGDKPPFNQNEVYCGNTLDITG